MTMKVLRLAALLCAVTCLGLSTSCSYVSNRARDFSDLFSFGVGAGIGANVRATNWVQTGAGFSIVKFRTLGRKVLRPIGLTGEAGIIGAPIFHYRVVEGQTEDASRLTMLGCTLLDPNDDKKWYRWGDPTYWHFLPDRQAFEENFDRRLFDVGASLYLGLGLEFDFNPYEFVDFWVGLVGFDISGDDSAGTVELSAEM